MDRIGLDVGFGDTKLVYYNEGQLQEIVTFPSLLGRSEAHARAASLGLGGKRRKVQNIEYQGQEYFVGEGVVIESRLTAARQDVERIGSIEERILMLAALARVGITEALVVTGLPVLWWDKRRILAKSWRGEHQIRVNGKPRTITIHEVRPVWQPVGTFYAHFLRDDGTAWADEEILRAGFGIVDIGHNTIDLTGLYNLQPVERWTSGVRVGVRDVLDVISADIEARYGIRRPLPELAQALRDGKLTIYRDTYSLKKLAGSALQSLAQEIVSQATRQWGQADRFHSVLITGGGAVLIGKAVAKAFPYNAEILPDPALANAIGFAKFAQRPIFQADK